MNARTLLLVAIVAVLSMFPSVNAQEIKRKDAGGDWSDASKWDPNQVPGPSHNVKHDSSLSASGVVMYDTDVDEANEDINDFEAESGDSRGLTFEGATNLTVANDFTITTGTGNYAVILANGTVLEVGGTITKGYWSVPTNALVEAGALSLSANTQWSLSGGEVLVAGSVSSGTGANSNVFTVLNGGLLTVDGTTATFSSLNVNPTGTVEISNELRAHNAIQVQGGTLSAGSAGMTGSPNSLNFFSINLDGTVTVDGTLRVRNGDAVFYGGPDSGTNTLTVGYLNIEEDEAFLGVLQPPDPDSSLDLIVKGDFDVATDTPGMTNFNPFGVSLTFDVNDTVSFEVFSTDYDVNSVGNVWYGVNKCGEFTVYNARPFAELNVTAGTTVEVTDNVVNAYRAGGYSQDALYVHGDVTVESGGELDLGSTVLYYTGNASGNIVGTKQQSTLRCYGDFDFDGDVDLGDFAELNLAFTGPGGSASNALLDADLDGDVDLGDFADFSLNFAGADIPCPGTCLESVGGTPTLEDMANWCLSNLTAGQREGFAETLYAAAEEAGETEEAADMLELAELITAE